MTRQRRRVEMRTHAQVEHGKALEHGGKLARCVLQIDRVSMKHGTACVG